MVAEAKAKACVLYVSQKLHGAFQGLHLGLAGLKSVYSGRLTTLCFLQTIIECLKQACTGELPPNTRSGQSFIMDPKVELKALVWHSVLAYVRLRVEGLSWPSMSCCVLIFRGAAGAEEHAAQL